MNINSVGSATDAYTSYSDSTVKQDVTPPKTEDSKAPASGVVYDKSSESQVDTTKKTYTPNTALVDQLKQDAKDRQEKLMSYVQQMMGGQGNALAQSDDIWKYLASGNFTVDELARKKAEEAISEDGYWGVKQTSDRILEFAKALSGNDPSKIDELRSAFEKGFGEATKTWGKELPEISQQTYSAVMKKFDDWAKESQSSNQNQQSQAAADPTVSTVAAAASSQQA